jgi:CheY-like chemotaxis protein
MVAVGHVLLVEDDEAAREMLATALRLIGFQVRASADGVGALRLLESFDPDVIVLDLGLPVASGFEILHELRAASQTRHTPVIAISGHDRGVRLARANPDFFATIAKPFDPERLISIVLRALRVQRS